MLHDSKSYQFYFNFCKQNIHTIPAVPVDVTTCKGIEKSQAALVQMVGNEVKECLVLSLESQSYTEYYLNGMSLSLYNVAVDDDSRFHGNLEFTYGNGNTCGKSKY